MSTSVSNIVLANDCADYLLTKITCIKDKLYAWIACISPPSSPCLPIIIIKQLYTFRYLTEEGVASTVKAMSNKSCESDIISIKLFKSLFNKNDAPRRRLDYYLQYFFYTTSKNKASDGKPLSKG